MENTCNINIESPDFEIRADKIIKTSAKTLIVYGIISMLLLGIIIYCLYNIVDIIQFYYGQRKDLQGSTDGNTPIKKSSDPTNPRDDNEHYVNSDTNSAEKTDEYLQYTQQINKSISEYKTYNEKMKAFYRQNKPGESPQDLIDSSVILKDSDNY